MSEGATSIKKAIPIIVITWILSLVTALAVVYVAPSIFPISVRTDDIADSAVITAKLADGTVTSAKILDGTLTAQDIADGSIMTVKIANGAVTTAKIGDGAITTDKLANEAVTTGKMDDEAVTTDKLANQTVTTDKIASSAIVTIKLADGSVTSAKILDGTVTAVDLADGSIIASKIANGAVTTEKIADGAVITSKIADGNLTTAKIADNNVTNVKLASGAIPFNSTYDSAQVTETSTTWVDMPNMSVTLTQNRTSHLLIMFSAVALMDTIGRSIDVRARVDNVDAYPSQVQLVPTEGYIGLSAYSYNFYLPSVSAGTYTIKIEWKIWGGTGYARERTLIVIALPA